AYLLVSDKHGFTHYIANIEKVWSEICESSGDIFGALQHFKQYNNFEKQVLNEKSERSIHELNTKHEIEIIERERIATDRLLYKMLPAVIVPRMKNGEKIADYFDSASIMFADMENFTTFSQLITPEQLIDILGVVFEVFDETIQAYGCEKIKTIGDSYMAVSGVPVFYDNHAERMASAILIIRDTLSERIVSYINDIADNLPPIHFRYGLHTGHIIAGIVGQERSLYDIYGDSVNIAARMESSGVSDTIQCSEGFVQHFIARGNGIILSGSSAKRFASENNNTMFSRFYFRERGIINIKGKGNMKTYFLEFAE
ncbi:MAG: adenylate/guanylate cyclase domain-containing protein, partial [Bacteroidetes bacterium]|nr:adenylate/guanylate cyclase domain-containing protein [Bacteroidota bacterium]